MYQGERHLDILAAAWGVEVVWGHSGGCSICLVSMASDKLGNISKYSESGVDGDSPWCCPGQRASERKLNKERTVQNRGRKGLLGVNMEFDHSYCFLALGGAVSPTCPIINRAGARGEVGVAGVCSPLLVLHDLETEITLRLALLKAPGSPSGKPASDEQKVREEGAPEHPPTVVVKSQPRSPVLCALGRLLPSTGGGAAGSSWGRCLPNPLPHSWSSRGRESQSDSDGESIVEPVLESSKTPGSKGLGGDRLSPTLQVK